MWTGHIAGMGDGGSFFRILTCKYMYVSVISTPTTPVENVVITTKILQDRNIHILDGTTVKNKGITIN